MKKLVGMYDLGGRLVNLYASDRNGGHFNCGTKSGVAEIDVGIQNKSWGNVCSTLTHEAMELACTDIGLRYVPSPDYASDNGGYFFSMNHTQFSEACARVGYFVATAMEPLARVFNKHVESVSKKKK